MTVMVIAFDVNETLLDLSVLDAPFAAAFGDASLRGQWFAQMLQLSFVGGLTGRYVDFPTAQLAALEMLAERTGVDLAAGTARTMVDAMRMLPAHPEVGDALARLAKTSLRTVALTNSPRVIAEAQLSNAGIRHHFDAVFSADAVHALKPAPAPYQMVAATAQVEVNEVRLVAAHAWDISGALAAGCRAAFVRRPGAVLSPIPPSPDIIGADLTEVVDQIIERDAGASA